MHFIAFENVQSRQQLKQHSNITKKLYTLYMIKKCIFSMKYPVHKQWLRQRIMNKQY